MVERHREIKLRERIAAHRGAPKQIERRLAIARHAPTRRVENGEGVLGRGIVLFRRHPVPASCLCSVPENPEARCIMAPQIVLRSGETLYCSEAKETHRLNGIPRRGAAEVAQRPKVVLTTCIAGFRISLAGLVRRGNVTALLGGFSRAEISGRRPHYQKEEDDGCNVRHRGPQLMLAARSKLL